MSLEETEHKIHQFCQLWQLYADILVELKKKSELSQDSAVASMQSVRTLHFRHNKAARGGNENIRNRKRTKNNQEQRLLSSATHHSTRGKNRNSQRQR